MPSPYEETTAEQLMAPRHQRVMVDLLRKIVGDALNFWGRQRIQIDVGVRNRLQEAKELVEMQRLFFSREEIGRVDGGAFTMRDARDVRSERWQNLRGRTRQEAMLVRDRLRAGEIAARVLREYRNATAHHSSAWRQSWTTTKAAVRLGDEMSS